MLCEEMLSHQQKQEVGVITPISTVLRTAPGIMTPYMADVGTLYSTKKVTVHGRFLPWSLGHWQFSSVVTQPRIVFGWSQNVTPVTTLSTVYIGVINLYKVRVVLFPGPTNPGMDCFQYHTWGRRVWSPFVSQWNVQLIFLCFMSAFTSYGNEHHHPETLNLLLPETKITGIWHDTKFIGDRHKLI